MKQLDILNLEWSSSDRDLHVVTPILIYLEKKYHVQFKTKSIFNGYYFLLRYRPKVLLISNFGGSELNHKIIKLAYQMGIRVVTLISEGNVKAEAVEQFLWGWNHDKRLYADKMLLWSKRSEKIFLSQYPELKEKLCTTGATGFDRYKLLAFTRKNKFLQEHGLRYKKIIGIAAWGFDHLFGDYYTKHESYYLDVFGQDQIDMHREDLFELQRVYQQLIEDNQEILFILRYHPGTIDFEKNEFFGLDKYSNVFISNRYQNRDYQISDLINISDLWIGYETTTALESWLLGKETFLINPTRSDFIRENVHRGSPIVASEEAAQKLIDEYFSQGKIEAFEDLKPLREEIVSDVIEYDDGKNHIRAAKEIVDILNFPPRKVDYGLKIYKEAFRQIVKLGLSNTLMKQRWKELAYKSDFAQPYQEIYRKAIDV